MNLDAMKTYDHDDSVDVVVVGTGAGGAPLLARLAEAGLRVVALEAGPNHDPAESTPDEVDATTINWMSSRFSGGDAPTAFAAERPERCVVRERCVRSSSRVRLLPLAHHERARCDQLAGAVLANPTSI